MHRTLVIITWQQSSLLHRTSVDGEPEGSTVCCDYSTVRIVKCRNTTNTKKRDTTTVAVCMDVEAVEHQKTERSLPPAHQSWFNTFVTSFKENKRDVKCKINKSCWWILYRTLFRSIGAACAVRWDCNCATTMFLTGDEMWRRVGLFEAALVGSIVKSCIVLQLVQVACDKVRTRALSSRGYLYLEDVLHVETCPSFMLFSPVNY